MNEHWNEFNVQRGFRRIQPLFEAIGGRGYIAGSYAAYMGAMAPIITPGDVDVFATSNQGADDIAANLMSNYGVNWTDNGIVLSSTSELNGLPIQIIRPDPLWKAFPDDILNAFDMDVCRAILLRPDCIIADHNVGLEYGKLLRIRNPLRSLKRVMKYHRRGVAFTDWELLKLFRAWDEMPSEQKQELVQRALPPVPVAGPEEGEDVVADDYTWDDSTYFEAE